MLRTALALVFGLLLAGCGGEPGIAGTYHAQSGLRQLVLSGDGAFRIMYGERTSPADKIGTYSVSGSTISFASKAAGDAAMSGQIEKDSVTIGGETYVRR
jgi:hypothetical protein